MPGLLTRSSAAQFGNAPAPVGSASAGGIWSKHRDSITFDQLQKFWNELSLQDRHELLRLDKQTVFEQARKNLYCSGCNGLLLEGFSQIVMYGKALQQDGGGLNLVDGLDSRHSRNNNKSEELQDPSVHPWGGLATTKDGFLTLLDCFIRSESLRSLQNVFDSARAREHERELLYPDACGGGGRGWISQGIAHYGRVHGMRETCALHTARLSCGTLVDFWSALGEETRSSLLRMKEEDFIERLMYRFDSKRFCRDCRRNVIREFKELKELKRMRREPRCNSWFCVADPAFNYEVSEDTVQADWHQSFTDTVGIYHHFEWAIGTGEGKTDILDFEDVGLHEKAQASGLDLAGLSSCFITLRAWKLDGRCTELCVKAHTFKGHQCVHRRLIVGDGFVTITKGESIRKFFEHAEEAEEEEDDDGVDKDGNELDSDGSRPQKHAKSPELAREFLLDAASVIFKEQVEKAFREGTTRQNAHSIFVCLTLKLLEERLHVACKEIITLAKQSKLLEEEEREKREEEERKERRRMKEREKKLRRKERLKGKERARKLIESKTLDNAFPTSLNESPASTPDESPATPDSGDTISEPGDTYNPDAINDYSSSQNTNSKSETFEQQYNTDGHGSFTMERAKSLRRKLRFRKDGTLDPLYNWYDKSRSSVNNENCFQQDETGLNGYTATPRGMNGMQKLTRERFMKTSARSCCARFSEKSHCSNTRVRDRQSCSCSQQVDYKVKDGYHTSTMRSGRDVKIGSRTEFAVDMPRSFYRSVKQNSGSRLPDNCILPKTKYVAGTSGKEVHTKQIWEPLDVRKRCSGSNSHPNITSIVAARGEDIALDKCESGSQQPSKLLESVDGLCLSEHSVNTDEVHSLTSSEVHKDCENSQKSGVGVVTFMEKSNCYLKNNSNEEVDCHVMINDCDPVGFSSSDNCSSCLSEGDSSASSSSAQNVESSSTSDSEDTSQHSDRATSVCNDSSFHQFDESPDEICKTNGSGASTGIATGFPADNFVETNVSRDHSSKLRHDSDNGQFGFALPRQHITMQNIHAPVFPPQNMEYYNQSSTTWPAASCNGYLQFPHLSHYVFPSPLGYGPVANQTSDFSMHYNSPQPMTSPVFYANKHPLHHLANRDNVSASKENLTSSGAQQISCVEPIGSQRLPERPSGQPTSNATFIGQNGLFGNAPRSCEESPFSLFHFGGPVAGAAAGFTANSLSSEVKMSGGVVPQLNPQTQICSKEEMKVEEYSLFSGGNGARFSFF